MVKDKSKKKEYAFILIVVLFSLIHCLYYVYKTRYSLYMGHDAEHYFEMAKRLIDAGMYSYWGGSADAYVTPIYPVFLSLIIRLVRLVSSSEYLMLNAIKLCQAVFISFGCLLSYRLAKRITGSFFAAGASAIFIATSDNLSFYATLLLTESLCFVLTLLFLNIFVDALNEQKSWYSFASGFVYALTILTRPPIACLIPFFVIILIVRKGKDAIYFALGMLLSFVPWWIRNIIVLGKFVAFSTQSNAFYYGFTDNPENYDLEEADSIIGNLKYIGIFFKEDFWGTLKYMTVTKFQRIFLATDSSTTGQLLLESMDLLIRKIFVTLGFAGMVASLCKKKYVFLICTFLFFMFASFLVIPVVRYGFQFYPFIGMFAGLLIEWTFGSSKGKQSISSATN